MSESVVQKAIWTPSWYELDQSISVGIRGKFWFYHDCVSLDEIANGCDLVFFNQLDSTSNSEQRFAAVTEIYHELLGPLARVDTDGLDYVFVTVSGDEIFVNAEEEPGKTYDDGLEVDDWSVIVTLAEVSDPIGEIV